MKKAFLFFMAFCLAGTANAQVQKTSFVEHFTQASCGPCASQNPTMYNTLDNFVAGGNEYVKVTYQVSWPGTDPMNAAYPAGPNDRRNYYSVTGVPDARLNGSDQGGTNGPNSIISTANLNTIAGQTTDVAITVSHTPTTGSDYTVNVKVQNVGSSPLAAGLKLHTALTEKEIIYANAPGSNGETEFFYVLRNMYNIDNASSTTGGYTMPAVPAGDSLVFSTTITAPNYVSDVSQIGFAIWVQDDNNKDVLQAAYSAPYVPPTALDVSTANAQYGGSNYCTNSNWTPSFEITNQTANVVTSIEAQYTINGGTPVTETVTGLSLAQGQSTTVTFPAATLSGGDNQILYGVNTLNGTAPDYVGSNNTGLSGVIHVLSSTATGSQLVQDFTNAPLPSGTWQYSQSLPGALFENPQGIPEGRFGVFGENSTSVDVSNCIRAAYGSGDWNNKTGAVIFDQINMTSHNTLSFDYAHALFNAGSGDSGLEILVSTDCGATWTSLWNRQGATLSTAPANNSAYFYPTPNSSDWVTATIDMTTYMNQDVAIKFEFSKGTSANNLYVDNINTSLVSSIPNIASISSLEIMPNPVSDVMNVELTVADATDLNVSIVNALGQKVQDVASQTFNGVNTLTVSTSDLSNGVYFLNVQSKEGVSSKRFIVSK